MDFIKCIENISTFVDLKRCATEYVIDYRQLSFDELKKAVIKTAPQYYNKDNLEKAIESMVLNPDRNVRVLYESIIIETLLNADDFTMSFHDLEDAVLEYEQSIIDASNEFDGYNDIPGGDIYKFVLETAWAFNDNVSVDEQNLLNKIKNRIGITRRINNITEASIGKYPKPENALHTKEEINKVRRILQSKGLLLSVRDSNNVDFDVVPTEIANTIREIYHIDIKNYGFEQLLQSKHVRSKKYLIKMIEKTGYALPKNPLMSVLQNIAKEKMTAHELLGGFSALDGLDKNTLSEWCSTLELTAYGSKSELIDRIVSYYDNLRQVIIEDGSDDRQIYYEFFSELATRNYSLLRQQGVINKDLDCEHYFEQATNYLFEKKLRVKPLMMAGTEHADGTLSLNDKLILWDNKSKESSVNLADHIKQFDRYITNSDKRVSVFIVIAPSFTPESATECAKYSMSHDTLILLVTADELKKLAESWSRTHPDESFPLGFFKQSGRFNIDLISM